MYAVYIYKKLPEDKSLSILLLVFDAIQLLIVCAAKAGLTKLNDFTSLLKLLVAIFWKPKLILNESATNMLFAIFRILWELLF